MDVDDFLLWAMKTNSGKTREEFIAETRRYALNFQDFLREPARAFFLIRARLVGALAPEDIQTWMSIAEGNGHIEKTIRNRETVWYVTGAGLDRLRKQGIR